MASMLRQVLTAFETGRGSMSLHQMARELNLEAGTLESMIDYWIRKGKIREVHQENNRCQTCSISGSDCHGCPFVMQTPRRYELVTGELVCTKECLLPSHHGCH